MADQSRAAVISTNGLDALIRALSARGRTVIGPTVRDDAIVLAEVQGGDDLPYGWGVELEAGRYRLTPRAESAAFAHSAGPQSWKAFLHPQRERQWSADRAADGAVVFSPESAPVSRSVPWTASASRSPCARSVPGETDGSGWPD